MDTVLLRTKLFRPQTRSDLVVRQRLFDRLDQTLERKLTLVSAPAGFGKSTLVSSWLTAIDRPSAWISLDAGDNDPSRFMHYLIAALRQLDLPDAEESGRTAEAALQAAQQTPLEGLMVMLINEIATWPQAFVLTLDDYHLIKDEQIHAAVEFLLDHMPAQMHLLLTSRSEPPLQLPRLRAMQQLNHLSASDLRFTLDETAVFFNDIMRLGLSSQDIAHLEKRSEGWAASLQLAAAALTADPDPAEQRRVIDAFAGDDRHIMDYLMSEVLQRQPRYIQDFLLQTSILSRLNVRLCNAVTGQVGSQPILETLDQANLFVEPLDNKRHWYRYHPLFAEFLQSRLARTDGVRSADLHAKAAVWYAEQDFIYEAIEHALEAGDAELAAHLLEEHGAIKLWSQGHLATLLQWLDRLPAETRDQRPYLAQTRAWALFGMGKWDALDQYLPEVEAVTKQATENPDGDFLRPPMPGQNEVLKAELSLFRGEMHEAEGLLQAALALLEEDDLVSLSMTLQSQGYIYRLQGEIDAASHALRESAAISAAAGNLANQLFALTDLAEVQIISGDLNSASETLAEALKLDAESEAGPTLVNCCPHITLGRLLCERNELTAAEEHLRYGQSLAEQAGLMGYVRQARLYLAHTALANGASDEAEQHLAEARRLGSNANTPWIADRVAMHTASLNLAQGKLEDALAWSRTVLTQAETRSYLPRYQGHEEKVLALHVLLANGVLDEAGELLARCMADAVANNWGQSQIRLSVFQALLSQNQGKGVAASQALRAALELAAFQAYRRPFLDAGPAITELLEGAVARDSQRGFAQELLDAAFLAAPTVDEPLSANDTLDEPLTERELEILQLIAAGRSNRQIGEELFIAIGTVGKHTSNIFLKLDAANRAAAVLRAQEIGLI